jgi:hypothetical protein
MAIIQPERSGVGGATHPLRIRSNECISNQIVGSHHHIAALQKPHSSGCFRAQSDFGRSCCLPLMARSLRIFQKTGLWRGVQRARARQR